MPIINKQYTVQLSGNDPSAIAVNDLIHLDRELSQLYGKNIRQGQNFRVKGVQVSMRGANDGYDVGLASAVRFSYAPHTKHSNKAWRDAFFMWKKQRNLRGVGMGTLAHEDMEFSYSTSYTSETGTSFLYQGGLADSDSDKMVIYGSSNETTNLFALEDHYESMHPVKPVPRYSWNNNPITETKYTSKFPEERSFWATSEASTVATFEVISTEVPVIEDPITSLTHLGGANMTADMHTLPEPANVLCGLIELDAWVVPDDTLAQLEDTAILYVTIWVESFKSLFKFYNPSPRSRKLSTAPRRKSSARRSRRRKSKR